MYAVIETGGKQYRVEVGTVLEVELLDVEPGQSITLDRVLLVADGDESAVGTPIVDGAAVEAEVVGATRGDKVIAFKYQPKARRRVKKGHRQNLTVLRISDIRLGGKSAAEDEAKAAPSKADERKRLEEAAARQAAEDAALAAKLKVAAPARPRQPPTPRPRPPRRPGRRAPRPLPLPSSRLPRSPRPWSPASRPRVAPAPEEKHSRAFEIHEDEAGQWRWRLRARNGELVAMSEQGFTTKAGVVKALDVVRRNVAEAEGHEEAATGDDAAEAKNIKGFEIYEDKLGPLALAPAGQQRRAPRDPRAGLREQGGRHQDARRRPAQRRRRRRPCRARRRRDSTTEAAPKRSRTKKDD